MREDVSSQYVKVLVNYIIFNRKHGGYDGR